MSDVLRLTKEQQLECAPNRISEWVNLGEFLDTQTWYCVDVTDPLNGQHKAGVIIPPCDEGCRPWEAAHQVTYCTVHHKHCTFTKYGPWCIVCFNRQS